MGNLLINIESFNWHNPNVNNSNSLKHFILSFENAKNRDSIYGHPKTFSFNLGWGDFHEIFFWGFEKTNAMFSWIDTELYNYLVTIFMYYSKTTENNAETFAQINAHFNGHNNGLIGCDNGDNVIHNVFNFERLWNWRITFKSANQNVINWNDDVSFFLPNIEYSNLYLAQKHIDDLNLSKIREEHDVVTLGAKLYCDNLYKLNKNNFELMAQAEVEGAEIARRNFYIFDAELTRNEQRLRNSKRSIYKITKHNETLYISIDFEKCNCYEVCDSNGRHLGEYRFDGLKNSNADATGGHNIWMISGQNN